MASYTWPRTGTTATGDAFRSISLIGTELDTGYATETGVPVPDGSTLTVEEWGVQASDGTTPAGLLAQLTQVDGTVIGEESTTLNTSPSVSVENTSGSTTWYLFRIKNETGTTYKENSTPSHALGTFIYDIS